jgi:predicted CoA-binding protein
MKISETIDAFLAQPAIAVVGVSRSARHFGNSACRVLRDKGYRVYPVHRCAAQIDGMKCYARLADLPERVGGVLIVVPPRDAIDVIYDAAAAGITRVWLQQGAESQEGLKVCEQLGVDVVSGECILMFARPTGIHRAHRFVRHMMHGLTA